MWNSLETNVASTSDGGIGGGATLMHHAPLSASQAQRALGRLAKVQRSIAVGPATIDGIHAGLMDHAGDRSASLAASRLNEST